MDQAAEYSALSGAWIYKHDEYHLYDPNCVMFWSPCESICGLHIFYVDEIWKCWSISWNGFKKARNSLLFLL